MVDNTGTNFNDTVFAWSLDDFNIPYDSWSSGAAIQLKNGATASEVEYDTTGNEPFLNNDGVNTHQVTGDVTNVDGTVTATFNGTTVVTQEYWQFTAPNPATGADAKWWFAKVTDENGNDMLLTNYTLGNSGSQAEFVLDDVDTSPSFNSADTTDFETVFDEGSVDSGTAGVYTNAGFWPRIDRATTPDAPAYQQNLSNGTVQGFSQVRVWNFDAVVLNPTDPNTGIRTITITDQLIEGQMETFDGDNYISDGSAAYDDSPVNEQDQFANVSFDGATTIQNLDYQAEAGFNFKVTLPDGTEEIHQLVLISFGETLGGGANTAWASTLNLSEYPENTTFEVVVASGDGSPGLDNPNLTADQELSIQYDQLVPCYVQGSMIETSKGAVAVEDLKVGDKIKTRDNGYVPLRWVDFSRVSRGDMAKSSSLRPVKIKAGALGNALPKQDLYVSPQHRMLVDSETAQEHFGTREVFAKAKDFVGTVPGIELAEMDCDIRYYHIMLDAHNVIYANGAPSESFYPGKASVCENNMEMRRQILDAVPQVAYLNEGGYPLARMHPKGNAMRKCLAEHVAWNMFVIDPLPLHKVLYRRLKAMVSSLLKTGSSVVQKADTTETDKAHVNG